MPRPEFFRSLGLFVQDDFLPGPVRSQIKAQIRTAESRKGAVVADSESAVVDETRRRVLCAQVDDSTLSSVKSHLLQLKPKLEEHFGVTLSDFETPGFLRYSQGAFYEPHLDVSPGMPADYLQRRVSVVVFLNAPGEADAPDCYGGGSLTFYGLMDGPQWEKCGFSLDAEPGLLVAFRSDTAHEVRPVTFGERFTIVTWFTA